jgi:Flp pilus assembly protein TadD
MAELGQALVGQGRYDEAETFLREALQLAPGNPALLAELGQALTGQGRHDDAETVLREAQKGTRKG